MRYTGFHRIIHIFHRELKKSWQIHFCNEIETDKLDELRNDHKNAGLTPPSYTAMVIKAIAMGIQQVSITYPEINSMLTGFLGWKTIHTFKQINAGVAISQEIEGNDRVAQGIIQNPEVTPLSQITAQLKRLSEQFTTDTKEKQNYNSLYRAPRLVQEFMLWSSRTFPKLRKQYRGTYSLTSVGKFGVDYQLTLPQTACLQFGFGAIRERPVIRNGNVIPAKTFYLTMSFDRRLMNGKPCALLMTKIRDILNSANFEPGFENTLTVS